ncbi:MAG: hypothetical protein M3P18_15965, partial [Actinomycetota bacterium]|nr:hypothetical protein [Actinomycetota bacterium]
MDEAQRSLPIEAALVKVQDNRAEQGRGPGPHRVRSQRSRRPDSNREPLDYKKRGWHRLRCLELAAVAVTLSGLSSLSPDHSVSLADPLADCPHWTVRW